MITKQSLIIMCMALLPFYATATQPASKPPVPKNTKALVKQSKFYPGKIWNDSEGKVINAHGGGVLYHEGIYYWYGEHKIRGKSEKTKADGGIHCYSSTDLINWDDEGVVMSVDYENEDSEISYGVVLERPKVVYKKISKKFIAYFKLYEKLHPYRIGFLGVAVADKPNGPFVYSHRTLAAGSKNGSGDFYMHTDEKGQLFHYSVRKPDKAFVRTKMSEDYLHATDEVTVLETILQHTEAPAGFVLKNKCHLRCSGSSGWKPNTARLYKAESIDGPVEYLENPCVGKPNPSNNMDINKTWGGQSSFAIKVQGKKDAYIAMFDVWKPNHPIDGRYIWLPITRSIRMAK